MTPMVGLNALDNFNFISPAVLPNGKLTDEFELASYADGFFTVLFFYSMDFSYICPTELIAIKNRWKEFEKRNIKLVAISGDSHLSHRQWQEGDPVDGGIGPIPFPMVSDISRQIMETYGIILSNSLCLRGTYIIDPKGHFRHISINDMTIGRNIDEILRTIDALNHYIKTGHVCPANWKPGDDSMIVQPESRQEYMLKNAANL